MLTTILFDLDGTLLPMDQDIFIQAYIGGMAKKLAPYGYDPEKLAKAIWAGTGAMIQNNGIALNEVVFWEIFSHYFGENSRKDEPLFEAFYRKEFQDVRHVCGFDSRAAETIHAIKAMGYRTVLATNPLFPAIATQSRVRWAGLEPEDFELITTYENASFCKPNPHYYQQILRTLDVKPEECLMVGNDVAEDMIAASVGMRVFLLIDCMINKQNKDITQYPNGSFPELLDYIRSL